MTSKEVTIVTGKVEVRAVDTSFARHVTVCTAASWRQVRQAPNTIPACNLAALAGGGGEGDWNGSYFYTQHNGDKLQHFGSLKPQTTHLEGIICRGEARGHSHSFIQWGYISRERGVKSYQVINYNITIAPLRHLWREIIWWWWRSQVPVALHPQRAPQLKCFGQNHKCGAIIGKIFWHQRNNILHYNKL